MNTQESYEAVRTALGDIAPEVDLAAVKPDRPFREQMEIDSFDFLNVLMRLQELSGVEVPEADYGKVSTLDQLVAYVRQKSSKP